MALDSGMNEQEAFNETLLNSSQAAQQYAQTTQITGESIAKFTSQQKMAEIATMAQNKSFTSVRSILNTYNTGLSEVGLSSQQFTQSVAQGNSVLGRYLANVGVGNAKMRSYVGTLIAAKAATIGLRIAQTALNAAIGFGLGLVVQFVMSGIAKAFEAIKDACKSTEEKMSDLNTKFQEISSKAQETAKNFQQLKSSVADIAPRFAELSKGVDSFGNNISLTDEEYTEFLKLNNEIAEMFPELNMGFDSNGNAMLALTGSADTLEQSLLDLVEAQRKLANEEIAKQIPDQIEALKDYDELSEKTLKDYKERLAWFEEAKNDFIENYYNDDIIENAKNMWGDDWYEELQKEADSSRFGVDAQLIWGTSEEDKEKWRAMIGKFTFEDGFIDWNKLLNSDEFASQMAGLEKYVNDFDVKTKEKWKSLASYMNAWVQTDETFNTLDDQMQSIVTNMVSNLEYGTDNLNEAEEIKKYIQDNILTPLSQATPEVKELFADMFSISTSDNTVEEYISEIKKKAQEIADNSDFTDDEVLKNTGFKDIISKYEENANSIVKSLKDTFSGTEDELKAKVFDLSPEQITKAFDYINKYGLKTWDDLEAAFENKTFEAVVDFKAEKEGLEAFNTALSESTSSTGLSSDAIAKLTSRYSDLEGHNDALSKLFERTTSGIHLNVAAVNELEKAYAKQKESDLESKLDGLKERYNSLTVEMDNCADAGKRATLYEQRNNVLNEINDTADLISQYQALTSSYNAWKEAQGATDQRDKYSNLASGYEQVQKLIDQGWFNDSEVGKYLDTLLNASERTKDNYADFQKLTEKIQGTSYSIADFFQMDENNNLVSDGLFNFLDTVKAKLGDDFVTIAKDGSYAWDFTGEKINKVADALGISTEAVGILEQALNDVTENVNLDSLLANVKDLPKGIQDISRDLKTALGKDASKYSLDFNFASFNETDLDNQITNIKKVISEKFTDTDGNIDLSIDGADEAIYILAELVRRKQELNEPTVMKIDTSKLSKDVQDTVGLLQNLETQFQGLDISNALGTGWSQDAQGEIRNLATTLNTLDPEIKAKLGLDSQEVQNAINSITSEDVVVNGKINLPEDSVNTLKSAVEGITPEMMVDIGVNSEAIDGFINTEHNTEGTVNWINNTTAVDNWMAQQHTASGIVNWKNDTSKLTTTYTGTGVITWNTAPKAQGTAYLQGGAFAQGNWGTKDSGIALGGEIGQEIVVRNGRFFTIGDNGAEFFKYKKGDIIFNAEQTRQILKNGKITNGKKRGVSYLYGTAFGDGSNAYDRRNRGSNTHSVGSSSSSSSSKSSSSSSKSSTSSKSSSSKSSEKEEKEPQIFDWIEIALSRIQRAIDNLSKKAESTFKKLSTRLSATNKKISKVNKEINLQQKAADRYMKEANNVGLSSALAKKVREGTISINEYDEDTQKLIEDYQKWYEKSLECKDAIADLHEELASLYQDIFDNTKTDYENQLGELEHMTKTYESGIDMLEAKGYLETAKYTEELKKIEEQNIDILNSELAALEKAFDNAMSSGEIEEYSEAWYDMKNDINSVKEEIVDANVQLAKFDKTLREIEWEHFDFGIEQISALNNEADFMIDLLDNEKLYDDRGNLTSNGLAVAGLHGQNYNVYMSLADKYAKEIIKLNSQIASDPNNTELIKRRQELIELQQDSILAAEDEKQAIVDLVEEGLNKELDALKEKIDLYKKALKEEKDLYEYQKKIEEQTQNISSLEKQLIAYENDDSEESKKKIQQIKVDLEKAREDLQESEYDKYIEDQEELLDNLYDEYEYLINQRLDNVDALISETISAINLGSSSIENTLNSVAGDVGYQMSDAMQQIWDGSIFGVIDDYGKGFNSKLTSVQTVLNSIDANTAAMVANSDKQASDFIESNISTSSDNSNTPKKNKQPKTENTKTQSKKEIKVGSKINAGSAYIYTNSNGGGKQKQYFASDPIYTVLGENNGYWKVRHHSASNGVTGWFKKSDVKAYKTGGLVDYTGLAQVDGTPGKPESFLDSEDTKNFISLRDYLRKVSEGDLQIQNDYSVFRDAFSAQHLPYLVDSLDKLMNVSQNAPNIRKEIHNEFNIEIPIEHVQDYNDFVKQLQGDSKFEKMVQSMTIDRIVGGSSLAKYNLKW